MIHVDLLRCTGCGACVQICPQKCIELKPNADGFVYPNIRTEHCVECNLCNNACPIEKSLDHNTSPKAYAVVTTDKDYLSLATSGGAFGAIAKYVLNHNGVVYGCAYGDGNTVAHIRAENEIQLQRIYGSKYVQSDTGNTFWQAKKDLAKGVLVFFTGTPCQIAGLKSYLGREYDNLITADLICHGVPSQAFFKTFVEYLAQKDDAHIDQLDFRSKDNRNWGLSGTYCGKYHKTGKSYKKPLNYFDQYYYYYFLKSLTYRESCYSCKYASANRQGDFTMGDLWGAEGYNLPFTVSNGCSLLLTNSEKASVIIGELELHKEEIPFSQAVKNNAQLREPSPRSAGRDAILRLYREGNAWQQQRYFKKKYFKARVISRMKYVVPKCLADRLLKLKYWVRKRR